MNDPKTTPASPVLHSIDGNWIKEPIPSLCGLSQYAYVAMHFHAVMLTQMVTDNHEEAFDEADAFFAELVKRTKS